MMHDWYKTGSLVNVITEGDRWVDTVEVERFVIQTDDPEESRAILELCHRMMDGELKGNGDGSNADCGQLHLISQTAV